MPDHSQEREVLPRVPATPTAPLPDQPQGRNESAEGLLKEIVEAANGVLMAYRRWSENGNTKDADRLEDWTDLMERAARHSPSPQEDR